MSNGFEFEIWQGGHRVASSWSLDRDQAMGNALHYFKVYRQDGPTELKEKIGRKRVSIILPFTQD